MRSKAGTPEEITRAVNLAMELADINTDARKAAFLAQIVEESDGLNTTREYASGQEYEGRKDLGNTEKGDGRRFAGRGFIQLTGRNNYTNAWLELGWDVEKNPKLYKGVDVVNPARAESLEDAARVTAWFWKKNNINELCDKLEYGKERETFYAISQAVNNPSGKPNGLETRQHYYLAAKKSWGYRGGQCTDERKPVYPFISIA